MIKPRSPRRLRDLRSTDFRRGDTLALSGCQAPSKARALLLLYFLLFSLSGCGSAGTGDPSMNIATDPPSGAVNVSPAAEIHATFSSPIDPATVNKDTFVVTGVSGEVSYRGQTATFTPAAPFEIGKTYQAVLTTGIKDLDGAPLPSIVIWSFTTGPTLGTPSDPAAPEITDVFPREDATDVAIDTPIRVVFSESILPETLRVETFFVQGVSGEIHYDDATDTATLQPTAPLKPQTTYQVTVTSDVRDHAGNPLPVWKSWTFTTRAVSAPVPLKIVSTMPDNTGSNLALNTSVKATFSKEINPQSLQGRFSLLAPDGKEIAASVSYDASSRTATLDPTGLLQPKTTYRVIVRKEVADLNGTPLGIDVQWSFTTGLAPDHTQPTVIQNFPVGNNVALGSAVTAQFSEPIKPETLQGHFMVLSGGKAVPISEMTYDAASRTARLVLFGVKRDTTYTAILTSGIQDAAGNHLVQASWNWKTTRRSRD
ncbi:MAG: Ig-like domain-containing protein [Nitrospirae bacterium]|nr:Ig-like domain-containing protein [Candidatus Manganitrophaceae bacterium]